MTPAERARFVAGYEAAMRDRCGKRLDNGRLCPSPLTRKGIAVEGGQITVLVTCPTCDWR